MADTLEILGTEYPDAIGIKATDDNNTELTFVRPQGTKNITTNGTGIDVTAYASVDVAVPSSTPTLQTKTATYTPTESQQTATITADNGYDGLEEVDITVNAISSTYIGSGIYRADENDISFDGNEVIVSDGYYDETETKVIPSANPLPDYTSGFETVSNTRKWYVRPEVSAGVMYGYDAGYFEGYYQGEKSYWNAVPSGTTVTPTTSAQTIGGSNYMMEGAVTVDAMPTGTAGTPTATKGAVSNHSVSVTPSVTNTTGYITGSTKTGTAVTVTAAELASGNKEITQNGTNIDVVGYSTVSVDVQGGGSGMTVGTATATPATASASISFSVSGEPTSFYVVSAADLATGAAPYKVAAVVFDGTNVIGQYITNTNNAQMTYSSSAFSKSYSNGTLTITASGANFQTNQYKLVYTVGGNSANIGTDDVQVGSGATSITFTGLTEEPTCFSCMFKNNIGTSSGYTRAHMVVFDGSSIYGMEMGSGSTASSNWTKSYSNGSLTITSTSTSAGGYFHQPGYYQLTYGIGGTVDIEIEPLSVTENGTYSESGKAYSPVVVNVSGGGSVTVKTTTMSNTSATATQIQFTSLTGQPKAFFCRCTSNLSRNSSNRYYYIADIRWDGSSTGGVVGNKYYVYNGQYSNQTTGYSQSYSNGTLTLTTTGSQTASPGSFYNGTYELVYVY